MAKLTTICFLTLLFISTLAEINALEDQCTHSLGCRGSLFTCLKDCRKKFRGFVGKCTKRPLLAVPPDSPPGRFTSPPGRSKIGCSCFCTCISKNKKGGKCSPKAPPPPPKPPTVFKVFP
ncbi:unnamed protein product [Ilex paraguariensis]|uniref:Uncharacterized protein n=1 Tax=Ilex paraguariensis TaxID=185542 RepID=A0ABC8SDV2_9AQUA